MKYIIGILFTLLLVTSCDSGRHTVHNNSVAVEPVFYSGCYRPGFGYLGDNGRYYPDGWTYMCNGVAHRNGVPYRGSLVGRMAVGAYFLLNGPGYGNYGVTHSTVVNKNVTIIKRDSPEYKKRLNRYNKTYTKRKKSGWVSKKEIARRKAQSKRDKARHKSSMATKSKKSKGSFFSRTSSKRSVNTYKTKTRKKSSFGSSSKRKSSFSRSSRRSSFRSSGRRYSDLRLKQDIKPISGALAKVMQMRGFSYVYKNDSTRTLGVIAQNIEGVVPEVVTMENTEYRSVDYVQLIPVLIEAIREQQKIIDDLRAKNIK